MNCTRCTGLMTRDDYFDLVGEAGQGWVVAWRCLICGDVIDSVILKNRSTLPEPMVDHGYHWPKVQCVSTVEHKARRSDPHREIGDDHDGIAPSARVPGLSHLADLRLVEMINGSVR